MDPLEIYKKESIERMKGYASNKSLIKASENFFNEIGIGRAEAVYNNYWLGTPILQLATDLLVFQNLIWESKPDLIIETGIAFGGSVLFNSSILQTMDYCGVIKNPHLIAIDIEIRSHNKKILENHPLSSYYTLIESSSTSNIAYKKILNRLTPKSNVLIFLDSNHSESHVLDELKLYAPLCRKENYIVVADTAIENAPDYMTSHREWGKSNSPMSAINKFLQECEKGNIRDKWTGDQCYFKIDPIPQANSIVTCCPNGFLRRIT